jgi:hypothetical protein
VNEKREIAARLREEIIRVHGSIKTFSDEIGKSQQYVNVYLSGINAPGPKVRQLLRKAGLDVPYVMTGRREGTRAELKALGDIKALLEEKGIRSAGELRQKLEQEEALARLLGAEAYSTIVRAAVAREKRSKYETKKKNKAPNI